MANLGLKVPLQPRLNWIGSVFPLQKRVVNYRDMVGRLMSDTDDTSLVRFKVILYFLREPGSYILGLCLEICASPHNQSLSGTLAHEA